MTTTNKIEIQDATEAKQKSYYVETGPLENTQLDRDVRFATAADAEQARSTLMSCRDRDGFAPEVMESDEPANTTFAQWTSTGW